MTIDRTTAKDPYLSGSLMRPWSPYCDACGRHGIERSGGMWCPWCRRWLNDPRGWRLYA